MALLFIDGFTHYSTLLDKWDYVSGVPVITGSAGRYGGNAMTFDTAEFVRKYIQPGVNEIIVGFAFRYTVTGNSSAIFLQFGGSSLQNHFTLTWHTTTSTFYFVAHAAGVQVGTTSSWTLNEWRYVEVKVKIGQTFGTYEVKIDGTTEFSGSNIDVYNNTDLETVEAVTFGPTGGNGTMQMCDLYIASTTGSPSNFLGVVTVETLRPTANGATINFTPSTGSNFQNIDDTTSDEDSTYNSSAVAGNRDTFTTGNLVTSGTVHALQVNVRARKTLAGVREITSAIRTGGSDFDGAAKQVSQVYRNIATIHATNPDTTAAWTVSEVNAAEFGYQLET